MTTTTETIDALLQRLGITKMDTIDVVFQRLGVTKMDTVDVVLKRLNIDTNTYTIDTFLAIFHIIANNSDVIFKRLGITKTDTIDVAFKRLGVTKQDTIDVLFKRLGVTKTTTVDVTLLNTTPPAPPADVPETLQITNGTDILWTRPISWKESQDCNPAIRPLPLSESEYLDASSWILKPRVIECKMRLTNSEKNILEKSIYSYVSTDGSTNKYLGFYLYYNDLVGGVFTPSYVWHYVVWIREKSYTFEYSYQNGREVRWWIVTLICDVQAFVGTNSTLPAWSDGYTTYTEDPYWSIYNIPYWDPLAMAVTIDSEKLDHILNFSRDDQHPPMIPNWINQVAEVDSYLWNECVLDVSYTCRMTNAEKYYVDLLLQNHQKIVYADYIHNLFSPKTGQSAPAYGAWIASVEAQWDSSNWIKPWKVIIALKANNSEVETRTANVTIESESYPSAGSDNLGTMYLDEVVAAQTLSSTPQTLDVGVHILYFSLPPASARFPSSLTGNQDDDWEISKRHHFYRSSNAYKLTTQTFGEESTLTVLVIGNCTIKARYRYVASCPCGEQITNGSFEDCSGCGGGGSFDGWSIGYYEYVNDHPHSGNSDCAITRTTGYIEQDLINPVPVSCLASDGTFGFWQDMYCNGGGSVTDEWDVILTFSDLTTTTFSFSRSFSRTCQQGSAYAGYQYYDLKALINACSDLSGKTITHIKIVGTYIQSTCHIDDVELWGSGSCCCC